MANLNPAAIDANGVYQPNTPIYGTPNCDFECDIFSFDRNIKTPYMENYNLNIQHQISSKVALQVGYVGSQGHRLFRFFDINQPRQATMTAMETLGQLPAQPVASIAFWISPLPATLVFRPARSTFFRKTPPVIPTTTRSRPACA